MNNIFWQTYANHSSSTCGIRVVDIWHAYIGNTPSKIRYLVNVESCPLGYVQLFTNPFVFLHISNKAKLRKKPLSRS